MGYQGYLPGTQIYQSTVIGQGYFASDYMDDVAAFLYNEDLRPDMGVGTKYEKQTVKTYTIGYMFSTDLLARTAIMGGTGEDGYMVATDATELETAFSEIIRSIKEEMSVFASPAVPTSGDGETYSGNHLYMGMFKPQEGFWIGNLKRYTLDPDHTMNSYQDANGVIKPNARYDWSKGVDGNDITKGGVAESLNDVLAGMVGVTNTKDLRRIYTYIASNGTNDITHSNNLFIENNSKLAADDGKLLGFAGGTSKKTIEAAITQTRLTPMGAVMHSVPTVVRYPSQTVVFVGANDGFLHAFLDNDSAAPEAWAFVMPEHLATITTARSKNPNDGVYFVDGSIKAKTIDGKIVLITGARRGGETYVALDITSYTAPKFLFQAPGFKNADGTSHADWANYSMGQSWADPRFIPAHNSVTPGGTYETQHNASVDKGTVFNAYGSETNGTFILLAGGYDTRYDTLAPDAVSGAKGAAVVGVNVLTGKPDNKFRQLNGKVSGIMKHSVLDVLPADMNGDALVDTLYFGDLGGHMFYAWPYSQSKGPGGGGTVYTYDPQEEFVPYLLFKADNGSGRKFMFAPDVMKEEGDEYIYFGSGDRESPLDKVVKNRFYCVKNIDKARLAATASDSNYLKEADLINITANLVQVGTDAEKQVAKDALEGGSGWYLDLLEGEKVVASPIVYRGFVIFTTFTPTYDDLPDPSDICKSGGSSGEARLYILNYLNGSGAMDRNGDDEVSTEDRATVIGNTIPSGPVLTLYQSVDDSGKSVVSAYITVSVGNTDVSGNQGIGNKTEKLGDFSDEPTLDGDMDIFFWREVY